MSRFAGWLLFVLALFSFPNAAAATPQKPLQILIVQSEDAVEQAQALTLALKRAASRSRTYSLAEGEFSLEVMTLALGCSDPPDGTCLAQIGAKIKSNQFIWGTMQRDGAKVIVHLRLWRRGGTGSEVTGRYSAGLTEADDDALADLAETLFSKLTGEAVTSAAAVASDEDLAEDVDLEDEAMGELVIFAGDVDGSIVIDGRSYGRIKNGYARVSVPAGEREVVVRAGGYHEAIADVVVEADERAEVRLYPERRDRPRKRNDDAETGGSQAAAGWAAIGVGAGLVAGGVYSALKVKSINSDQDFKSYRAQFRANQNVCSEAERGTVVEGEASPAKIADMCSEAHTFEALQYLLFGLGGVAVGTGVLILITDSPSEDAAVDRGPEEAYRAKPRFAVSKTGAEVGVQLSF